MTIFITGGAGFIGTNFINNWFQNTNETVINVDKLTYAANHNENAGLINIEGDIADNALIKNLLTTHKPRAIIHFAAETHVDRSIEGPVNFIETNITGTFHLLATTLAWWKNLSETEKQTFRFVHISTDEVFGSLGDNDVAFSEQHAIQPNNPYAASKAASDHLVRAYHHTYHLPVITTHCSNNYGPHQFPEKLIPLVIAKALKGENIPLYGDGQHIRDWLHVDDHCAALRLVLEKGKTGESYNIGSHTEKTNLSVVESICNILDTIRPRADKVSYRSQITFVADRMGHDRRYAINADKISTELGWKPLESFDNGLLKTVTWYTKQIYTA